MENHHRKREFSHEYLRFPSFFDQKSRSSLRFSKLSCEILKWMGQWRTFKHFLVGGIPTPLKNINQLGWWNSQLNGKIKNVPNHQPVLVDSDSTAWIGSKHCLLKVATKTIPLEFDIWLVVYLPLWKIKNVPNHQPDMNFESVFPTSCAPIECYLSLKCPTVICFCFPRFFLCTHQSNTFSQSHRVRWVNSLHVLSESHQYWL